DYQINFRDMHNQWMRGGQAAAARISGDPLAQAQMALSILRSQGPSAWSTNTPAIQALLGLPTTTTIPTAGGLTVGTPPKKPKKPAVISGAALLTVGLRTRLASDAAKASSTTGATALGWLKKQQQDLVDARKLLEQKQKGSTGKQRDAIRLEISNIDGQL